MKEKLAIGIFFLVSYFSFAIAWQTQSKNYSNHSSIIEDRIVPPASVQLALAMGDPFLAANLESFRASSTWIDNAGSASSNASFQLRTRKVISELNPWHEDNYYHSNALLSWSGLPTEGNDILKIATHARFWDEFPAFFHGFNSHYFFKNDKEAIEYIEIAIKRTKNNKSSWRRLQLMIKANLLHSDSAAIEFLKKEAKKTTDKKLYHMLKIRITRLENLEILKNAQTKYEQDNGHPLTDPFELINKKYIKQFPTDPLGVGYEFSGNEFKIITIRPKN